ncbi:MAG TPA: efflux RND transporter permease subunit [Acidobacteriaceae bacterium]|nr:efflux RND transporter permease subunit [Acidobacteriaceae bacterium]
MWIVRLALRRPYTFAVFALLLLILGPLSIINTPTDIFPNINIPVVSIVWQYQGLSAVDMAHRIVTITERALTTTVDNIDHVESQSLVGVAVVKVYFQPTVTLSTAIAQITAISQTQLRQLPQGTTPPLIITYTASSVPILQLGLSGEGLSEQQLNDYGLNSIRTQFATIEGAESPYPYGGKQRQVQVDLNMQALQARGLSPSDVVNAIGTQNLILPSGTVKVGSFEYQLATNSAPTTIQGLNDLPIKSVNGAIVYIRDVAHVRDGFPPQTNIVRVDGQRASLMSVLKNGNVSTLQVISRIRAMLPIIASQLPPQLRITPLSDQSIFVRGAIEGVVREGIIAGCLTAVMILVFLGSWRSTLIIAVSIPLSILVSLILLGALGETINIMTLGGLALAVGILVDDATVEIENINRNLEEGKEVEQAILDGAAQIAVPAFVSTLSICIVFVPMFFMGGVAKYLFVPLAEAVIFAMLASYFLSRTVVPTMAKFLLHEHDPASEKQKHHSRNPLVRAQLAFEYRFEQLRTFYFRLLQFAIGHSAIFLILFFAFTVGSFALLYPWLGQDFFPSVDAGSFKLHLRAQTGTRIEETARLCDEVDGAIRQQIPKSELVSIIDNIGIPYSGLNLSYTSTGVVGPADADITVQLAEKHHPTDVYVQHLRAKLGAQFPGTIFYTLPVDMVTQILNFGLPAPIDIQVIGNNLEGNRRFIDRLFRDIIYVPGTADLHIQQPFNNPQFLIDVNRSKAQDIGLTQRDVAGSLLVATSGSFQTTPTFWLDPRNGVSYNIAAQTPQYTLQSLADLENIPVTTPSAAATITPNPNLSVGAANLLPVTTGAAPSNAPGVQPIQILGNVATFVRSAEPATVSHYNIAPVLDIYGNVVNSDLRSVSDDIAQIVAKHRKELPRGSQIVIRGQVQTMNSSFIGLIGGLAFSILLVYLLIVVNFQSWLDPFMIIAALPAALSGIVWMLFITGTHISVPALTGSIMTMGVATANSILVISFAREQLEETVGDARAAALRAGYTRFRPVIMTALAMIIGMVPMALGLGDGGEQNAPLGRAVIGGLLFATTATLFFVPTFFSVIHGWLGRRRKSAVAPSGGADLEA